MALLEIQHDKTKETTEVDRHHPYAGNDVDVDGRRVCPIGFYSGSGHRFCLFDRAHPAHAKKLELEAGLLHWHCSSS